MLDDDNNTTSETIILKLSTRAGIPAALVQSNPNNIPFHSPLTRNNEPVEINVQVLPDHSIPDDNKTKNPTRSIRTNDNIDAKIITLNSGYQTRSRNADNIGSTTTLSPISSDIESQRKRILNFVVSDAQPQSFQPRPSTTSTSSTSTSTTTSTTTEPSQYSEQLGQDLDSTNAFVNSQSSFDSHPTTTTNAPNVLISGIHLPPNRLPKTDNIKLVLTSGLRDVSNEEIMQPRVEQGSVEIVPLYIRESDSKPLVDATVEPTTYSPAKPFRTIKRPVVETDTPVEQDSQDGEESMTNIQKRPYEQNLETAAENPASKLVSKFSYKYLDERNYRNKPYINEPTPHFTSRSNNFKEVLNKTYETSTPSKSFVSPYTSLRSILHDESVKSTSLRPVIRPSPINNKNQTLTSSSPPPFRSYYSITGTPRSTPLASSTTQRLIKSTTTEPSTTTTSTESTTITTKSTIPTVVTPNVSDEWIPLSSTEIDRYVKSPKFIQHNIRNQYQSFSTTENSVDNDVPTTYLSHHPEQVYRRKVIRTRPLQVSTPPPVQYDEEDNDEILDVVRNSQFSKLLESVLDGSTPKKYETRKASNQAAPITTTTTSERYPEYGYDSTTRLIEITDRPHQYFSHYRHLSTERTIGSAISSTQRYVNSTTPKLSDEELREKFRATVEMPEFNIPTESERKLYKQIAADDDDDTNEFDLTTLTNTITEVTTQSTTSTTTITAKPSRTTTIPTTTEELAVPTTSSTTPKSSSTTNSINTIPPRASRVNAAIKTTIAAASLPRRVTTAPVSLKCTDNSPNAKCNEIPSRYHQRFFFVK